MSNSAWIGLALPPTTSWSNPFNPRGGIATARFEQRIEESIYLILSTAAGERVMLPDFGCGIHRLVFAPNNSATLARVVHSARQALTAGEPRIDVLALDAQAAVD